VGSATVTGNRQCACQWSGSLFDPSYLALTYLVPKERVLSYIMHVITKAKGLLKQIDPIGLCDPN
jgi:hypothetical protein